MLSSAMEGIFVPQETPSDRYNFDPISFVCFLPQPFLFFSRAEEMISYSNTESGINRKMWSDHLSIFKDSSSFVRCLLTVSGDLQYTAMKA
ncbi:hypothetical protein CEXT_418991 [Caerostris extrusa]|uniref:Uncharacterized protein n=1 Tax=Caerostris extrusa TaxID=172846 RepID=A0AAV4P935_CAEEX|nr:hypothetical protein CEXT_418991 [Caerostris extrusa]